MTTIHWTTLAPIASMREHVADMVPPVAMRSSTTTTFWPDCTESTCNSKLSEPYSFSYVRRVTAPGSFPALRTGTNAAPNFNARSGPNRNPRASRPTTTSIRFPEQFCFSRSNMMSMRLWNAFASRRTGNMSRNRTPGLGKSGWSVIRARMSSRDLFCAILSIKSWALENPYTAARFVDYIPPMSLSLRLRRLAANRSIVQTLCTSVEAEKSDDGADLPWKRPYLTKESDPVSKTNAPRNVSNRLFSAESLYVRSKFSVSNSKHGV